METSHLSGRQKHFFEALDRVQQLSGSDAVQFDYNIRNRLFLLAINVPTFASTQLAEVISKDYGTKNCVALQNSTQRFSRINQTIRRLKATITPDIEKSPQWQVVSEFEPMHLSKTMAQSMLSHLHTHFDTLYEQKLTPGSTYYNTDITNGLNAAEQRFGGSVRFCAFNDQNNLLGNYRNGALELHNLSAEPIQHRWKHYTINMASEQQLLLAAMEDAAHMCAHYNRLNKQKVAAMEAAITEMRAAYAGATMSPEAYAAKEAEQERLRAQQEAAAEEQRKLAEQQRLEAQRLADEKRTAAEEQRRQQLELEALRLLPFLFSGVAQSVLERGKPDRQLPTKPNERAAALRLRDVVSREIIPLKSALNRNFTPHNDLGNALFLDDKSAVMRALLQLSEGRSAAENSTGRAKAAAAMAQVLNLPEDESPLYAANREGQQKLIEALSQSPVVLTLALGDARQTHRISQIQQQLFPERKSTLTENQRQQLLHERGALALEAMKAAGVTLPPELEARFTERLGPPAPPPEPEKPPEPKPEPEKPAEQEKQPEPAAPLPQTPPPPASVEALISATRDYIESKLPDHYQLRMHLRQSGENVIVITLADKEGRSLSPLELRTHQPDINQALELFRRVQGEALCIPGVVDYTDPAIVQTADMHLHEPIPNATPTSRAQPRHGSYYAQLAFPASHTRQRAEMSVNLGLPNTPENLAEAAQRAARVVQLIEEQRHHFNQHSHGDYLGVTKRNIGEYLRQETETALKQWVSPESQYIHEQFPASIRINGQGENWVIIPPMRQTGMVDNSWTQPVRFVIGGYQLEAGNAEINTHINDKAAAQARGQHIIEGLVASLNNARFATDPDNPRQLRTLSPAELAADPTIIDHSRLRRIIGKLRAPYEQDIAVIERDRQTLPDGKNRFTLELTRGAHNQLEEPLRETGGQPAARILRQFTAPAGQDVAGFITAIQRSVRDNLEASYNPTTRETDTPDGTAREKPRLRFAPDRSRTAFDLAIASALRTHPGITYQRPGHIQRLEEVENPGGQANARQ